MSGSNVNGIKSGDCIDLEFSGGSSNGVGSNVVGSNSGASGTTVSGSNIDCSNGCEGCDAAQFG